MALWWWFCPCRVGGAVWNHTAWLFPLMPLPTESLFYSYFLSRNKYRKNITCKNIWQFQLCINLLPLALIWRSAPCLKHWNQRRFGDAAFTIPLGKQWDHMSPWSPSWLSAGIDECCRSANESGHQWLKNSCLEKRFATRSVNWTVVQHFWLSAVVRLSECRKKHSFYSRKRQHSGCQWCVEAVAGAVGPAISGSRSTDSTSRKDTANVANIPKTTMFNRHINTNHDLQTLHLCTDQELK